MNSPAVDLLGDPVVTRRHRGAPEQAALHEVLAALRSHPRVAWCERQNTGAIRVEGRFVRFGWRGAADIVGQLVTGQFLACEVKGPDGRLRPEQARFLELVNAHGGLAFTARSCRDVFAALGPPGATA